jgi:DNA-binding response OmpR family regulator
MLAAEPEGRASAGRRAPVVVAEDSHLMGQILKAILSRLDREVHVAADGSAALALVHEHHPALLVLDLNMPKRGGIEVLRAIRRDPATQGIRVLVMTATLDPHIEGIVREAGADDFLRKPAEVRTILERARALLPPEDAAAPRGEGA